MSDSQAYEELAVSSEGVEVMKRFEEDEFPVPAIAFEFTSDRDESVTVRLSDTVPEDIEVEDLGFHPEYGSEYWTIEGDTIVFERDLDANSEYTTVYGIRATGSDDVEQFLTEPTLESVEPPLPEEEDVIPESDDNVIKDAIAGDGEIPGLEEEGGDEGGAADDQDDLATLDLKDPNDPHAGAGGESEAADADEGEGSVEGSGVVAAMADEIRQKNVSADDVKMLQRALNAVEGETGGSSAGSGATAARLEQLQSDISDLRAYTSALEEFLDEHGTGTEIIEEFERRLDEFDGKLGSIRSEIDANSQDVSTLSDEVESVSADMDSVTSDIDEVTEEMASVSDDVADVSEEVDGVSEDVANVSEEVDEVTEEMDEVTEEMNEVSEDVETFGDDIESLQEAIDGLEDDIDDLEDKVSEEDVVERIEDIEESMDDLQTWQEQIKQTFGG